LPAGGVGWSSLERWRAAIASFFSISSNFKEYISYPRESPQPVRSNDQSIGFSISQDSEHHVLLANEEAKSIPDLGEGKGFSAKTIKTGS